MLRAIALVRQKVKNVVLVVIGPAVEKEKQKILTLMTELELLANKDVFFTGPIQNEKIGPAHTAADVFANTSETEGICFSFLEAMCFKIPIVAFDVGGNPDVIENKRNGYLIQFGNVNAFAAALERILKHPRISKRMGMTGYKKLLRNFYLPNIARRLIKLIR